MRSPKPEAQDPQIMVAYQAGQATFERGQYREAVAHLTQAQALVEPGSALGGEIQLWLVTAYEAVGQREAAIALCRQLGVHPDHSTRKQSQRVLYILEAPELALHAEWLTQIPDLSETTDRDPTARLGRNVTTARPQSPRTSLPSEPLDLSQVNTKENGFIWMALGTVTVLLLVLFQFS